MRQRYSTKKSQSCCRSFGIHFKSVDNYAMLIRVFNAIISSQLQEEANIESFSNYYINKNNLCAPEDLEYLIFQILNEFLIPINMNGYNYLCKAILYNILNLPSNISLTKQIYPMVAKDVNSSAACIEHSIRHTINTAWQNGEKKWQNILVIKDLLICCLLIWSQN